MLTNFDLTTRTRLALPRTSWQLCLLAIIGGTVSASLIVLFIWSIESLHNILLDDIDHYTSLNDISRFILPIYRCTVYFGVCDNNRLSVFSNRYSIRIAQTESRLRRHPVLEIRLINFFGGVLALASGFSVGREGPAVHLGAACSGYLGSRLNLPSNAIRTLSACGVAAGIAACFKHACRRSNFRDGSYFARIQGSYVYSYHVGIDHWLDDHQPSIWTSSSI